MFPRRLQLGLDGELLPPEVSVLRTVVGDSAGIIICSPEYARGVSGAMKNALDWLVGSLEFPGKPVALINASQRASDADTQLRLTLRTMNARFVESASAVVPLLGLQQEARELAAIPAIRGQIITLLETFRDAILSGNT